MAHVRLYAHSGVVFPKAHQGDRDQYGDVVAMRKHPYLAREVLKVGSEAVFSGAELSADRNINLLVVETDGALRFEIVPNGHDRKADQDSPVLLHGVTQLEFGPEWRISLIEAQ